jgi:hypothetical protein
VRIENKKAFELHKIGIEECEPKEVEEEEELDDILLLGGASDIDLGSSFSKTLRIND